MNVLKYAVVAALLMLSTCLTAQNQAFPAEYYKKALWMTTRFYGAQRSGDGPNWLIAEHSASFGTAYKGGKSFVKDADGSYDLTGGWFDCGDFVKFGQTEFYSCYVLLLGYSEFPSGYSDLYSSDYHGYVKAKNYTYEAAKGVPNGIPDVLDECKYATDYFMKCIRSADKFYYQVGEGDADHRVWSTSVYKSAKQTVANGGESDGSRPVYSVSTGATSMVALCGASLAAMSRLFKPYDAAYAAKCLEKAKLCAKFVEQGSLGNVGSATGSFYQAKPDYKTDLVILYSELYRATWTTDYKTKAGKYFDKYSDHGYSLCYNNTNDLADYVYYIVTKSSDALSHLKKYASDYQGDNYLLNVRGDAEWGTLRYMAAQAFSRALYSKAIGAKKIDPYTLKSIDYILGDNANGFSFVVGMGSKYPKLPHYRNVYQNDDNNMYACSLPDKFAQLGYLIGGYRNGESYANDNINDYMRGEGGIDYNAGLVSALGYVVSIISPSTISTPTATSDIKAREGADSEALVFDITGRPFWRRDA